MNIDELFGYCQYRDDEYIFNFKNYDIQFIPSSSSKIITNNVSHTFEPITEKNDKGFISDFILEGMLFDGRKIIFCIQDNPGYKNGIWNYKVKWVYIFCSNSEQLQIRGINYVSNEINFLYNTKKYIDDDFQLEDGSFKNYTFNIKSLERKKLGDFSIDGKNINIYGDMTWKRNYKSTNTLEMWSKLSLEFDQDLEDVSLIWRLSILQKCVIDFFTYRLNNSFTSIETYSYNENNKRYPTGNLFIDVSVDIENDAKVIEHLIDMEDFNNIGVLYNLIDDGKVQLFHLPKKSSEMHVYDASRMLGIMISFEKLFAWKFDKKNIRSDNYLEMLDRIKNVLENNKNDIIDGLTGQKKKFGRTLSLISKAEVDYASMVKHVIKKYSLCSIFIKNIYAEENVTNELTKLSERLNTLRNGMSHGKVKVDFTSDNTKDLKLLEIVVYVVILSEFGIDEDNMIRKIIWLFNIRPFFN